MAIAIAIPTTFLSDWVIGLLYGDKFYGAGSVLMIHIWAGVFVFLGVASGKWFLSENLQVLSFYRTLLGGIYANNTYPADFIYSNLIIECNIIHAAYE
jgi:O-antigen/teichoic acid export membrane protein